MMEHVKGQNIQDARLLKCYGLSELDISDALQTLFGQQDIIEWKVYFIHPEHHITITVSKIDNQNITKVLEQAEKAIRDVIGPYIIAIDHNTLEKTVGDMLNHRGFTLAVAESCTGGLIGNRLTNVSGSSRYFLGGVIAYSNESKQNLLGVSSETLRRHGAVSDQTAREMAKGVQKRFQSHMALSVTGIAGPDGGSDDKPVGSVHIGLVANDDIFSDKYCFKGTREQVKLESSEMAFDWIKRYLNNDPFLPGL